MPTTVNDAAARTEMLEFDPNSSVALNSTKKDEGEKADQAEGQKGHSENKSAAKEEEKITEEEQNIQGMKEEEVPVEVEPKTGISFPVKLGDGKLLKAVGLRKKSMLGISIKIYAFGSFPSLKYPISLTCI